MVENEGMNEDQAWPQWGDFQAGGGFHELSLRWRRAMLGGGLAVALMAYCFQTSLEQLDTEQLQCLFPVAFALPAGLCWLWGPGALAGASRPLTRHRESLLTERQERRDLWAFVLVLLLACLTGLGGNLLLLLVFSPLIAFRLGSRLWCEVDLLGGRVYYHRTFLGLQITRLGPGLEEATGIVSGIKVDRPGEDPVFSVCAILPGRAPLALDSLSRSREESHTLGRRLGLQLNLPHESFDYDVDGQRLHDLRGRVRWKPLSVRNNPPVRGGKLPPTEET